MNTNQSVSQNMNNGPSVSSKKQLGSTNTSGTKGIHFLRMLADRTSTDRASASNLGVFVDVCTMDIRSNELCRAVALGATRLVRTLLEGEFDVSSTNLDGQTALHVLIMARDFTVQDDYHMLELLLNHNLPINKQDRYGKTALMYAVALRRDVMVVDTLLRYEGDIFMQDNLGFTVLIYAFNLESEQTDSNEESAVLKRLSTHCQQLGRQMVHIETPLSSNFMSFLKIQKLVGSDHGAVSITTQPPLSRGASIECGSGSPNPTRQNISRRFSEFGTRLGNLVSSTPKTQLIPQPAPFTHKGHPTLERPAPVGEAKTHLQSPNMKDRRRRSVNSPLPVKDNSLMDPIVNAHFPSSRGFDIQDRSTMRRHSYQASSEALPIPEVVEEESHQSAETRRSIPTEYALMNADVVPVLSVTDASDV